MSTLQACVTDADVGALCHTGDMLILHTSDWHLGRTLHGVSLGESADAFIDWLVALVRDRGVDAVLISGDVFDRAVPPVDALARMRRALRELTTLTTVILTSGNHDGAARLGLFADMLTPSLHVVTDPEAIGRPVEAGGALVYPMPYLEPDLVRQLLSDLEPEGESGLPAPLPRSHQAVLAAALRRVRADLAARRHTGDERPAIAMPHAFVTGAQPSDSERDIQVGGVPSVSADLFDTLGAETPLTHGLDYVAAGHLHRPQNISGAAVPIRYAGSPIAYSFSEAGATKSVTLVTTDATSVTDIEVVPIPTLHGICVLEGTMDELLANPDQEARASYVSITVTDDARPERMVPRIRALYPHALVVVHRPAQAPTLAPARQVRPSRDPREVTEEFYEAVGGRPLSDQERILAQDVWAQLRGKDMQ